MIPRRLVLPPQELLSSLRHKETFRKGLSIVVAYSLVSYLIVEYAPTVNSFSP